MADNRVLFATLLALIARLILHVLKSIFIFSQQQLAIPLMSSRLWNLLVPDEGS